MLESDLVTAFVDSVLNKRDLDILDSLFDRRYRDIDPITIPGYPNRAVQDQQYVRALCEFLSSPSVDLHFTLEDTFGVPGRIAYQLFGEGLISLASPPLHTGAPKALSDGINAESITKRVPAAAALSSAERVGLSRSGKLLNGMLHVEYRSVGIFRIGHGRLIERRGQIVVT
jgi:hypothetical protein